MADRLYSDEELWGSSSETPAEPATESFSDEGAPAQSATKIYSDEDLWGSPETDLGWKADLAAGWESLKQGWAGARLAGSESALKDARPEKDFVPQYPGDLPREALEQSRDSAIQDLGATASELKKYPEPPSVKAFNNAKTWDEALGALASDPLTISRSTVLRSAPSSLPSVVGGVIGSAAGPFGAAILAGSGSAMTEFGSAVADGLQQYGADLNDPNSIMKVWRQHGEEISSKAQIRAGIVGAADAVTAGIGSKIAAIDGGTLKRELGKLASGTAVQMAGGAGGELGAQVATGQQIQPGAILGEALGEAVSGAGETVGQMAVEGYKASTVSERGPAPDENVALSTNPPANPPTAPTQNISPDQALAAQAATGQAPAPAAPSFKPLPGESPSDFAKRVSRERSNAAAPAATNPPATPPVTPADNQQAVAPTAAAGEPSAAVGAVPTAPPAPAPAPNADLTANVPLDTGDLQLADIPFDARRIDNTDPNRPKSVAYSGKSKIIDYADRKMVVVNINGVSVPFYLSTGEGGKKNVAAGKWYPFFGIGADGWINKTNEADINNYYGIPELRAAAEQLDRTIGDIRGKRPDDVIVNPREIEGPHIDFINNGLSPVRHSDADAIDRLKQNIAGLAQRIRAGAAPNAEITANVPEAPTKEVTPEVTVPESEDTLNIQRAELVDPDSERIVVQYPKGTNMKLYPKPDAARIERFPSGKYGTFDFDATKISRDQIRAAARAGKLNELLGLGPFNKQEVAKSAAAGATPVAVTERTPEGTEVKAAAGTTETAPVQQQALEETKAEPENTVQVEDPRKVIEERLEPAPTRRVVTQGYEGPNADLVQNRIAYLEQLAADESKSEAARREARTRATDFKNYAELRDKLFEDNNTPEATRAQVRALAPDDVVTGQTRKGETVTGRIEGWGSSGAIGIVDADGFNHDILPHTVTNVEMAGGAQAPAPKAPPKAEAAKEVSKAREEKKEAAQANTASVAFMMTKAMRAKLAERGYTAEQIKNMKPAEAQEILKSEPKNAPTPEAPAPKAEQAKATSKAREEKVEAAPAKPRVLEDQSIESKKAKQEQAEQNEIIADQIKPFLKGRGKVKTLKDADEKTGKNWTPAERAARRKLNEDGEKVAKQFAPTPEVSRIERDFMDENPAKRGNARAAIRARAEAMIKAADDAGISLPEKVYGNTDSSMDLGAGAMNLVVARDLLNALKSPYKDVADHYMDFLSRDMRLRKGLLDEVVSERRTEIDDKLRQKQGGNIEQISVNKVGDTSAEEDTELSADTKDVADAKVVGKDDVETKVSRTAKMAPKLDDGTEKGNIKFKDGDARARAASEVRSVSAEEKAKVEAQLRAMGILKREDASGNSIARRPLRDNEILDSKPLTEALDRIGKLPGNKINKYIINKILNRLRAKVGGVDIKIVEQATLDDMFDAKKPGAVNGYYDPKGGYIVVSANFMARNNGKYDASLIAHEGVHAYLQEAVDSDENLKKDIQDILDHVKSIAPPSMKKAYGLRDVHEFLAEAMSNPTFQNFLMRTTIPESMRSKYDAPTTKLWQKLVSAIAKHMGLTGTKEIDALSYTMRLVERAEDVRNRLTSEGNSSIAASENQAAPVFYSAVQRAVEAMKQGKAVAGQWMSTIRKTPGVKPDELKFLGLEDWLNSQNGPVTKQQLLDYIAANQLEVSEVAMKDTLTPPEIEAAQARSEELIDLAYRRELTDEERAELKEARRKVDDFEKTSLTRYSNMRLAGPFNNYRELLITLPDNGGETYSMDLHWPGKKNFIAHVRFDERVDAQGRKVLFINELQSDWHSEGRTSGYRNAKTKEQLEDLDLMKRNYESARDRIQDQITDVVMADDYDSEANITKREELEAEMDKLHEEFIKSYNETTAGVPEAPFKTTWNELAMKRMARWAADNGFDVIAWPSTPEQVAEIEKWPNLEKRFNAEKNKNEYFVSDGNEEKNVTGIIESYTKYLPQTVNNMFKKFGVKTISTQLQPSSKEVYRGNIPTIDEMVALYRELRKQGDYEVADAAYALRDHMESGLPIELALTDVRYTEGDDATDALLDAMGGDLGFDTTQPDVNAIVLTPEMASSVLQGQPLFRERDYASELMEAGVPEDVARELHDTITSELGKSIDPSTLPLLMSDMIAAYAQPTTSQGNSSNPPPPTPPINSGATPASSAAPSPYVAATGGKFRRFAMKVTTLDYIRQTYNKAFGGLLDPYVKVIQRYENVVSQTSERHDKDAADFLDLLRTDPEEGRKMADLAMEATRMNVRLGPGADNKHLAGKGKRSHQGRTKLAALNARFDQLLPETRALYKRMTENYRETHNNNVRALAYNLLTSLDLKNPLSNSDLMMLLDKTVNGTLTKEDANIIGEPKIYKELKRATTLRTIQGDYFPQMRFGDFVVLTKDKIADPGIAYVTTPGNQRIPVKTTVNDNVVSFQIDPMQRGGQAALNRAVMKYIEQSDLTLLRATKTYVERKTGKVTKPGDMDMSLDYDLVWNLEFQTRGVNFFESEVEANKFRNEVQAASGSQLAEPPSEVLNRRKGGEQFEKLISGSALAEVTKRINARKDLKPWQRKQMEAAVREAIISQMTGNRAQKRHMARRNVKGASSDIARAAVTYGQAAGNYYAMLTTTNEVRESFNALVEFEAKNQNKPGGGVRSMVMEELTARQETLADPLYNYKLMQHIATASFLDKLWSPAHSIINFTQVVGNTLPYLGGKYGNVRTAAAISSAYAKMGVGGTLLGGVKNTATSLKDWQRSWLDTTDLVGSVKKKLGPEYEALIDELVERGLLEPNSGFEIGAAVSGGSGVVGSTLAKLDRAARQLPAAVEVVNRVVAAVSAYDLSISQSNENNVGAGKAKQDAIQEAYNVVSMTQGDYRKSNNPRFTRDPRLSWAMQFKKYAVMQTQLIGDMYSRILTGATAEEKLIAAKQLTNQIAMQTMLAGAVGLPGLEVIKLGAMVLSFFFPDLGWDDLEEKLKKLLDESVGKTASELIRKGVISRAIGVDVSSRMSQADLWTGFTPDTFDKDTIPKYLGSLILGAPGGTAVDWAVGLKALKDGDVLKAFEKIVPIKTVSDAVAAYNGLTEGKMTPAEAVVKTLGFQPRRMANINEERSKEIREGKAVSDERNALYKEYINAATPGQVARVTAKIRDFNKRMGKNGRKLSVKSLEKKRKREMERYQ